MGIDSATPHTERPALHRWGGLPTKLQHAAVGGVCQSPLHLEERERKRDTDTFGFKTLNCRTRFHLLPTKPFPLVSFHPISNAHLAVTVGIWNGGLAPLLELNCLMIYMWTHQESNPDLTVIIKACSSISGKAVKTGGK